MPSIVCSGCNHSFEVGKSAAGKGVMCGQCGKMILVSRSLFEDDLPHTEKPDQPAWSGPGLGEQIHEIMDEPKNLGLISLGMAFFAILLLCLPAAGFYVGLFLCGGGLLLSFIGVIQLIIKRRGRGLAYVLGSAVACVLAGLLISLPYLYRK
jgi:hypothetical protein